MKNLAEELKKLDGAIVVFKSLVPHGNYLNTYKVQSAPATIPPMFLKEVGVVGCPRTELLDKISTKFILHHVKDDIVCIESVEFRNHYLDMSHLKDNLSLQQNNRVRVTHCNEIPKELPWAQFSIKGDNLSDVRIRSERWTDRWCMKQKTSSIVKGYQHDPNTLPSEAEARFTILFPEEIQDRYVVVAAPENKNLKTISFNYIYKAGMSRTDTKTFENAVTLTLEATKNFGTQAFTSGGVKFGAEYSSKWSESTANTFSAETQISTTFDIPPGKKVVIKQLQAKYGVLTVLHNYISVETVDIDSNAS